MKDSFKNDSGNWNLVKIVRDCESRLKKAGIPIQSIIEINIIRDRYLFGRIYTTYFANSFVLDIANAYRNPKYELTEVQTVISHMLLHTIKGCMNHEEKWREYAEEADQKCGLHIIAHEELRPKAGVKWESGTVVGKAVSSKERCCFLDYKEKLEEMVGVCSDELKKIGLDIGRVSDVLFRRDKNYGWCRKNDDDTFTILVSQKYAREDADLFGLKGLLCHELLHTCPDDNADEYADAHGPKWREMARKVEKEYGYKIMSQSYTDAIKKTSDTPKQRFICPICGGYYDVYNKDDDAESDALYCNWCRHKMNAVKTEDMGFLDVLYFMLGEYQDKMKIAGIPIGMISGIGFVVDKSTGLHDNWDGSFSIDLPEKFGKQEMLNSNELKAYLCQELLKTCEGCDDQGDKWGEYVQKAENALGFSLISPEGNVTEIEGGGGINS